MFKVQLGKCWKNFEDLIIIFCEIPKTFWGYVTEKYHCNTLYYIRLFDSGSINTIWDVEDVLRIQSWSSYQFRVNMIENSILSFQVNFTIVFYIFWLSRLLFWWNHKRGSGIRNSEILPKDIVLLMFSRSRKFQNIRECRKCSVYFNINFISVGHHYWW